MGIEDLLSRLIDAVTANTEQLIKLNEGREAALEKLGAAASATETPKRTRSKKADTETPAGTGSEGAQDGAAGKNDDAPAGTASGAAAAAPASEAAKPQVPTSDDIIKFATAWISEIADAQDPERVRRLGVIASVKDHFSLAKLPGDANDEQRTKILFYLGRAKAGKDIDFAAAYNFDGDPAQDVAAPAATTGAGGDFDGIG